MRTAALLLAAASLCRGASVYDCRYFDCVTPFLITPVALPPGSSIPQPAGWPGAPLTFTPIRAASTGYVFGSVTDGGSTGPFLSDGVNTFFSLNWPDFHFIDLANNGLILAEEINDAPFLTGLQGTRVPIRPVLQAPYEYWIGASGRALAMNDAGNAFLVTGVVKLQFVDPLLPTLVERDLTMIWSNGFQPAAIPEPSAGALLVVGLLLGLGSRRLRH